MTDPLTSAMVFLLYAIAAALVLLISAVVVVMIIDVSQSKPSTRPSDCTNGNPDCRFGARCGECRGDNII